MQDLGVQMCCLPGPAVSMQDGCQMDIGPYRADGYVELRASRAPDGSIVQLILESNGANWHGDAREPQYEGIDFYMRLVFGAYATSPVNMCVIVK
jgi:hypothetical protein